MSSRLLLALISSALSALSTAQTPPEAPNYFKAAGLVIGKEGIFNADGSYRINLPRTDVTFKNSNGMPIPADMGLATYIAINGSEEHALAVGDIAMLEPEIDTVFDKLRAGGFEIVALHNHMTAENPRLFFAHFQAMGTTPQLAATFRSAIDVLGHVKASKKNSGKPGKPKLDPESLAGILGVKGQTFPSGVLRYSTPRKDISVSLGDQKFPPGMGLASWVAFSACECGLTMAMGDTCCQRWELQNVIDAFRKANIHITAIHNHILGGSQEVMFMHFESEGDSSAVAAGVKSGWKQLGLKAN